jgi:hypothetical protein
MSFLCKPIENIACTWYANLYSLFLNIETINELSPSQNPVTHQGCSKLFLSTVFVDKLFICLVLIPFNYDILYVNVFNTLFIL